MHNFKGLGLRVLTSVLFGPTVKHGMHERFTDKHALSPPAALIKDTTSVYIVVEPKHLMTLVHR